jgi:hypothetical protein
MTTFEGLFDFPDLLNGQSELLTPPDSSDNEHSDKYTKDKDDTWYNLPTDSEDKDEDNDLSPSLALVLPVQPILSTEIVVSTTTRKEHFTGARIKAIYMLKQKKSLA